MNAYLNVYTFVFTDVNDKGYLTELKIDVEGFNESEAFDKIYELDNNNLIDYSKAKNTRRKLYSNEENECEGFHEFICIGSKPKYPYHQRAFRKNYGNAITINLLDIIDNMTDDELSRVKNLIKEIEIDRNKIF